MSHVDLETKIPNNVGLRDDKRLLRALEKWQPAFIDWWSDSKFYAWEKFLHGLSHDVRT